ncbi:NADH-quinone oxidoreductase subunit NuoG [Colwelliaceae bacterium BS250]
MTDNNQQSSTNNSLLTIHVDGVAYKVDPTDNLLAGVLSNKLNLPYFCWHPSMGSVGACRQCAVTVFSDESQSNGRLAMACMTPVTDGMHIGLGDDYSSAFREQVIAAMMTNHPHDCPVCAEGGECHLQDMTVMTGHSVREYKGDKRTFVNQDLGPNVGHEMNRCITCYRCVRFYKDYAGGTDFGVYGSRNQVCFGRQQDGVLESEFAGNLIEVCPTGVFTDKAFSAHYSRKWDLQSAPSICKGCSVGCNLSVGERYGSVRRVVNRYNDNINGYFLCDRGRFGFSYVNASDRINHTQGIKFTDNSPTEQVTAKDVHISLAKYKAEQFIAIGSPRASLETNTTLKHLFSAKHFCAGLTQAQMHMLKINQRLNRQAKIANIKQIEQADLVIVLGEDVTQTAPRIALAIRQSVRNASLLIADRLRIPRWQDEAVRTAAGKVLSPLFISAINASKLDDVATAVNYSNSDDIAQIIAAISTKLTNENAQLNSLSTEQQSFVEQIVAALATAQNPLIVSGHSLDNPEILAQCLQLNSQHKNKFSFAIMSEHANSMGLANLIDDDTLSLEQVIEQVSLTNQSEKPNQNGQASSLCIVENELSNLTSVQQHQLLSSATTILAIDHNETIVTKHADVILPAATFSESQGLLVNYQGLVQCFYPAFAPKLPILASWRYVQMIDGVLGKGELKDVTTDSTQNLNSGINQCWSVLNRIEEHFPNTEAFIAEQFLLKTARQSHRASGRTAMMANQTVHEAKATIDGNSNYNFSMEGGNVNSTSAMPFTWAPGWNSNQSISKYQQQVGGPLINAAPIVNIFDPNADDEPIASTFATEPDSLDGQSLDTRADNINENALTIYPAKHIFGNDYLGLKGSEFKLTAPIPYIQVTTLTAQKYNITDCQYIDINIDGRAFICELIITAQHAEHSATLYLNEQASEMFELSDVSIKPASSMQIDAFKHKLRDDLATIETQQQQQLAAIKQNDQFIPIRLMAGGLDDG